MSQLGRLEQFGGVIDRCGRYAVGLKQRGTFGFVPGGGPLGDSGVDEFGVFDARGALVETCRPIRFAERRAQPPPLVVLHSGDPNQTVETGEQS